MKGLGVHVDHLGRGGPGRLSFDGNTGQDSFERRASPSKLLFRPTIDPRTLREGSCYKTKGFEAVNSTVFNKGR